MGTGAAEARFWTEPRRVIVRRSHAGHVSNRGTGNAAQAARSALRPLRRFVCGCIPGRRAKAVCPEASTYGCAMLRRDGPYRSRYRMGRTGVPGEQRRSASAFLFRRRRRSSQRSSAMQRRSTIPHRSIRTERDCSKVTWFSTFPMGMPSTSPGKSLNRPRHGAFQADCCLKTFRTCRLRAAVPVWTRQLRGLGAGFCSPAQCLIIEDQLDRGAGRISGIETLEEIR